MPENALLNAANTANTALLHACQCMSRPKHARVQQYNLMIPYHQLQFISWWQST